MSISTTTFERYAPSGPVTSLRRLQATYGALAKAASATRDPVVDEEFRLYVTPGALEQFATEHAAELVTVEVDLTGSTPSLDDVDVAPLDAADVQRLGFARYPWGRGLDHSITRRGATSGASRETVRRYAVHCLRRWTNADGNEPAVGRVGSEHPDGWVIEKLQQLGRRDDLGEAIDDALPADFARDGSRRVVVTVAVRLDPERLCHSPTATSDSGYYSPGQLHVLNAAMRARKRRKLATKNSSTQVRGEGTCLVSDRETDVFGTVDDPLAFFTVQQTDSFPNLSRADAWRTHPISAEMALLIQASSQLLERCQHTRRGRRVYTLPYFVEMTPERARAIHTAIEETTAESECTMAALHRAVRTQLPKSAPELRFYVVVVRNESGDLTVLHEHPDVTMQSVRDVATAHVATLDGPTFDPESGFERPSEWPPIGRGSDESTVVESVVSGRYAGGTVGPANESVPRIDDVQEWLTARLLTGRTVPVETLLSAYVDGLAQIRRNDRHSRLSVNHLKEQYAQLETLARADRLAASTERDELTLAPDRSPAGQGTSGVDEERPLAFDGGPPLTSPESMQAFRLQRFLAARPALRDHEPRRAAFLAGVLVGRVGVCQSRDRPLRRTALVQYPASEMTSSRLRTVVPTLLDRAANAGAPTDAVAPVTPDLESRLSYALAASRSEDWPISAADLQFHYALGQGFGMSGSQRVGGLEADQRTERQPNRPARSHLPEIR